MKTVVALALGLLLAPAAFAQSADKQATPSAPALPPPGMDDPGVKATAPALPAMHDARGPRDARGEAPPQVSVHQRGDDTVQEYTRNGQLYMVVVTPKHGVAQTYMVGPNGELRDEHGKKPLRPVMYKVLEWGKSPPAESASDGD